MPSRIIEKLKANTPYHFAMRAHNVAGWGTLSAEVDHTTLYDTTTPADLSSITLLLLTGVFQVKWAKPSTIDLRGGGYKVYVYTANTPASAVLIREVGYTSDSTEIFIGEKSQNVSITITAGTTYYWWVTTLDASGNESAKVATTPTSGSINAAAAQTGYANAPWDEPGAGAFGVDSAAHMAALVELVKDIQAALVANGILATPA